MWLYTNTLCIALYEICSSIANTTWHYYINIRYLTNAIAWLNTCHTVNPNEIINICIAITLSAFIWCHISWADKITDTSYCFLLFNVNEISSIIISICHWSTATDTQLLCIVIHQLQYIYSNCKHSEVENANTIDWMHTNWHRT